MLNNTYLSKLPKNKLLAANKICTDFIEGELEEKAEDVALTLSVLLEEELKPSEFNKDFDLRIGGVGFGFSLFDSLLPKKAALHKIEEIHKIVKALLAKATILDPSLINTFLVELSEDETRRIDVLLADIRNIIRESTVINDEHKRRLLKVVNGLQAEIDKEYSDFRVFIDGMVEVSEAVGEVGENVKPVFDRIKEVFGIADKIRRAKEAIEAPGRPELLPPPPKELPAPDPSELER